ncbi:MAG: MFS transporter [Dermatophilaceae bacterium]|nr:MFS transporter [Dermatophilaceae bacterium]NUR79747.1 MFS transporter [Dermatophilaceae bacterium]
MTRPATEPAPQLLSRAHAPLALGVVALVTLGAFENRAVSTALPSIVHDLDAITGYGVVTAAPLASYLVSLAAAGWWADRSGPAPVLRAGMLAFLVGMTVTATAATLPLLVAGRLLGGLAEGLLDVGVMVLVARALDPRLRPRVMALFAAAWVLPSVLGPAVTGAVTEAVGWRWVFAAGPVVLVPVWLALRPAIAASDARDASETPSPARRPLHLVLPWALVAATALVTLSVVAERRVAGQVSPVLVLAAALVALALAARRLLPEGALRAACGIGGVVALRGLLSAAFMGVGAFLPLVLTVLRHHGPLTAGISLSITGVTWSAGSAVQSRLDERPMLLLRLGFGLLTVGLATTSLIVWADAPTALGLSGWAVAGLGIGLTSSTLSVLTMGASADADQGHHNAGGQMAASMASAVFLAVAGGVIAWFGAPSREAFGVISGLAVSVGVLAVVVTGRARCAVDVMTRRA